MKTYISIVLTYFLSYIGLAQNNANGNMFNSGTESTVLKSQKIDLDSYNDLIVFAKNSQLATKLTKINYFKKLMNDKDFDKYCATEVDQKLFENLKTIDEAYQVIFNKHRFFFLFLEKRDYKNKTVQLILLKPGGEELFIVESKISVYKKGRNRGQFYIDESTYNAMINEFVNYIKQNSKLYK